MVCSKGTRIGFIFCLHLLIKTCFQAKSTSRVIVWLVVFTALLSLTIYGIAEVMSNHLAFPVVTVSHLENRGELEFPAVTICNANRIHCGNLLAEHSRVRDRDNNTFELLEELLIISNCGPKEQYWNQLSDLSRFIVIYMFKAAHL